MKELTIRALQEYLEKNVMSEAQRREGMTVEYFDIYAPDQGDAIALWAWNLDGEILTYRVFGWIYNKATEIASMTHDTTLSRGFGEVILRDLEGKILATTTHEFKSDRLYDGHIRHAKRTALENAYEPEDGLELRKERQGY